MAVTSVKILHNGWSGSETAGAGITFNVIYQVEVDDRNDGPLIVLNANDGTTRVPIVGDSYQVGNDIDTFAFVKSVSPTPVAEKVWNVAVTFGPLEPSESPDGPQGQEPTGLDENQQPTDDPTEEAVIISVSAVNAKRAALHGAYIGHGEAIGDDPFIIDHSSFIGNRPPIPNPPITTPDGHGGIKNRTSITNSVFTPFDPPPEIDYSQIRVSISMNLRVAPVDWLDYVNSVNTIAIDFRDAIGDVLAFAEPFACRCMAVSYAPRIKNGFLFYATDVEFLIDNLFTHRLDILDRGYCETNNNGVSEGDSGKNNITDESGLPLAEPVLLDGHGAMLDTEQFDAVYLRYAVYPEFDFHQWGIQDPQGLQNRLN